MATQEANNKITLSKTTILKQNGMVILPLQEYKRLCESAIPTYYLKGKEAEKLDKLVRDGMNEYKAGKCKAIKSLADLD